MPKENDKLFRFRNVKRYLLYVSIFVFISFIFARVLYEEVFKQDSLNQSNRDYVECISPDVSIDDFSEQILELFSANVIATRYNKPFCLEKQAGYLRNEFEVKEFDEMILWNRTGACRECATKPSVFPYLWSVSLSKWFPNSKITKFETNKFRETVQPFRCPFFENGNVIHIVENEDHAPYIDIAERMYVDSGGRKVHLFVDGLRDNFKEFNKVPYIFVHLNIDSMIAWSCFLEATRFAYGKSKLGLSVVLIGNAQTVFSNSFQELKEVEQHALI